MHVYPTHILRASAFARADHPALATIYRADEKGGTIWVEALQGRPLRQGLALNARQREDMTAALTALHQAGGTHGEVDGSHVFIHEGAVKLAFPGDAVPSGQLGPAAEADDFDAAARLA